VDAATPPFDVLSSGQTIAMVEVSCPICSAIEARLVAYRDRLPVLQNVTFPTREVALASPCAPFELVACNRCGFMFNAKFDSSLLTYDTDYDNHVESAIFERYYEELARMMIDRFDLSQGDVVYDVGCGRGTFLKTLCRLAPFITGIGIDPSCDPLETDNLRLIRGRFSEDLIQKDAKVVLLRHVLEHIDRPLAFISDLRKAIGSVPLFVEVPDTTWILSNGTFWDLCYEHCNYFVPSTLRSLLASAGFEVLAQETSFGGQYQWAICRSGSMEIERRPAPVLEMAEGYGAREARFVRSAETALRTAIERGACAIWGMATKGVVFASMFDPALITGGVDANPRKHGRFAPGSGLEIHPPRWLAQFNDKATAFVMNPNYLGEIQAETQRLGVRVDLRPVLT